MNSQFKKTINGVEGFKQTKFNCFPSLLYLKLTCRTSGQDDSVGRYASLLHTTKKKDNNQFENKKTTRTARKLNCIEVQEPRS